MRRYPLQPYPPRSRLTWVSHVCVLSAGLPSIAPKEAAAFEAAGCRRLPGARAQRRRWLQRKWSRMPDQPLASGRQSPRHTKLQAPKAGLQRRASTRNAAAPSRQIESRISTLVKRSMIGKRLLQPRTPVVPGTPAVAVPQCRCASLRRCAGCLQGWTVEATTAP